MASYGVAGGNPFGICPGDPGDLGFSVTNGDTSPLAAMAMGGYAGRSLGCAGAMMGVMYDVEAWPSAHPTYRPLPNPVTGMLQTGGADTLKVMGFGLQLGYFYNSQVTANGAFGQHRSASVNGHILSGTAGAPALVTLVRGDFVARTYSRSGSGFNAFGSDQGVTTSLTYDGTKFSEQFADGTVINYEAQVAGGNPVTHQITKVTDPRGLVLTYTYGASPPLCANIE